MQVYGNNAKKKTAVYKWVTRFSEGRESVTNDKKSGWPKTLQKFVNLCVKIIG
jgi:hypothetical protein